MDREACIRKIASVGLHSKRCVSDLYDTSLTAALFPSNLIIAAPEASRSPYVLKCKEKGLPVHPARIPREVPNFFLRLLTRIGDTGFDPFGGSNVFAREAETLGKHWITSDKIWSTLKVRSLAKDITNNSCSRR